MYPLTFLTEVKVAPHQVRGGTGKRGVNLVADAQKGKERHYCSLALSITPRTVPHLMRDQYRS